MDSYQGDDTGSFNSDQFLKRFTSGSLYSLAVIEKFVFYTTPTCNTEHSRQMVGHTLESVTPIALESDM